MLLMIGRHTSQIVKRTSFNSSTTQILGLFQTVIYRIFLMSILSIFLKNPLRNLSLIHWIDSVNISKCILIYPGWLLIYLRSQPCHLNVSGVLAKLVLPLLHGKVISVEKLWSRVNIYDLGFQPALCR